MKLDDLLYRVKLLTPEEKVIEDFKVSSFAAAVSMAYFYFENLGYSYIQVRIEHILNGRSEFKIYRSNFELSKM